MLRYTCNSFIFKSLHVTENLPVTYSENRINLNGDLPHPAPKDGKCP